MNNLAGLRNRIHRSSFRPMVLFVTVLAGIYVFCWVISSFRLHGDNETRNIPHLATIALILGISYSFVLPVTVLGLVAALKRNVALVRTYAYLSIPSSILILGGSLTQIIVHFKMKDSLINECVNSTATTQETVFYNWGMFGPSRKATLDSNEVRAWCNSAWNDGSWSSIVAFLFMIFVVFFFLYVVFTFYKQLMDPTSPVNAVRAPSSQFHVSLPQYNPPFTAPEYVPPYDAKYGYNEDEDATFIGDKGDLKNPFIDNDRSSLRSVAPPYEEQPKRAE